MEQEARSNEAMLGGRYEHVRELGRGAMGRVLLVRDRVSGAERAAKVVPEAEAARLRWELSVLAGLSHASLTAVFELLRLDAPLGAPFRLDAGTSVLVEERAPGSASDAVARELASDRERLVCFAVRAGEACARALAALHGAGLVHGDVKPANVVVPDPPADAALSKLVDLGLAGPPGISMRVSGTPAYLAPEGWLGERWPATDVWALGATMVHWLRGAPGGASSSTSVSAELLHALRRSHGVSLPDDVPGALSTLIAEMLAEDAAQRPAAREVVRRLAALSADASGDVHSLLEGATPAEQARRATVRPLVGREAERERLLSLLEAGGVVVVHGPPGSGRSRVVREAVRALQARRAEQGGRVPTYLLARSLEGSRIEHGAVLHVESDAELAAAAGALVRASALGGVELSVVLERATPIAGLAEVVHGPLDREAIAALVAELLELPVARLPRTLVEGALVASAGLPGRLCRLVASALSEGRDPSRPEVMRSLAREVGTALAVPEAAWALASALALGGGALGPIDARAALGADEGVGLRLASQAVLLESSGLATLEPSGRVALRADVVARVRGAITTGDRARLATRLALSADPLVRAHARLATGDARAAADALLEAAEEAREAGDPERAQACIEEALAVAPALGCDARIARAGADAARAAGDVACARRLAAGGAERDDALIALRSELARLSGDLEAARLEAEGARSAALRLALRARAELGAGRAAEARQSAEEALTEAEREAAGSGSGTGTGTGTGTGSGSVVRLARVRALEALALSAHVLSELSLARQAQVELARLSASMPSAHERLAWEARALSIGAALDLAERHVDRAERSLGRALELAERAGERHAAASFLVNVGLGRLEAGALGPALESLREGARRLALLDRPRDLTRALYNLANAAALIGDDALATQALDRAEVEARGVGDEAALALAAVVRAELALREGRLRAAAERLTETVARAPLSVRAAVAARLAAAWAVLGELDRAGKALAISVEGDPLEHALAVARVELSRGDAAAAERAAARALALGAEGASFELRVRAALLGAECAELAGLRAEAAERLGRARALLDVAASTLAGAARARMRAIPAYQRALAALPATDGAPADDLSRRVLQLARRLVTEPRARRVEEGLLEAVLELSGAERAFVVVRDDAGALHVRTSRGVGRGELAKSERPSLSIAARAIDEGQPVVTIDALADARLGAAASVHALALRSVLAIPLVLGSKEPAAHAALCLDDRLRPAAFEPRVVAAVAELAAFGSAALVAADRALAERRAARLAGRRERRLAHELEARNVELVALRDGARPSHADPFASIVGGSDSLRALLALARRVAASEAPVLVTGESGTGKELVARALHAAGPRAGRPFVGESCAAIPETLLESTLFGHVRGAFTGADRARRGLFDVADGGTLFLDEIGETSPAMQAKLLRVLADGEVRAVGSERVRRVDVRLITATHRDLSALVAAGRFREDLYYRIAVVTLSLPPLRERPGDVEELAAHFLARHARGRVVRFDPAALAALARASWPGNVRQLENEVQRALLVADDVVRVEHLSPSVRGEPAEDAAEPLSLRPQVDALERRLIERALAACEGNQTRAAEALGVSRFGLAKMMKRLGVRPG